MNGNDMLNAMTDVDEKHILAAEKKPVRKKPIFLGAISAIAAAAIIAAVGIRSIGKDKPGKTDKNLPMINVQLVNNGMGVGGMGDPDTENGNPWNESMDFKTLPVYRSESTDPDREKMMSMLQSTVQELGYDFSQMDIISDNTLSEEQERKLREQFKSYGAPDEEIERVVRTSKINSYITAENDDLWISIDSIYTISVNWRNKGIMLPDDVRPPESPSFDDIDKAGKYILEKYPGLFNIKEPVLNFYPEYKGSVEYYSGGSDIDALLNYNFNSVRISFNNAKEAFSLWLFTDSGLEKIGDYPIITPEKAEELLFNGNYLTNLNYELKGGEEIAKTELIYLTGIGYEYAMPYYRFLVVLNEDEINTSDNGLARPEYIGEMPCYSYYVPAVESAYISNMPTPELRHNGASANTQLPPSS